MKTTYLITFEHTEIVNHRVIEKALESMAQSFHHHKPILSVDIQAVDGIQEIPEAANDHTSR